MKNLVKKSRAIISARRNFKKETTEEQKHRLEICSNCEYNSNNKKKLSFRDKVMLFLNHFLNVIFGVYIDLEAICTLCGCEIVHKTTQTDEELKCPLKKW